MHPLTVVGKSRCFCQPDAAAAAVSLSRAPMWRPHPLLRPLTYSRVAAPYYVGGTSFSRNPPMPKEVRSGSARDGVLPCCCSSLLLFLLLLLLAAVPAAPLCYDHSTGV
jgi:hypothetical protein